MKLYSSIDGAEPQSIGLELSIRADAGVKCSGSCALTPAARNVGSRARERRLMAEAV